MDRLTAVSMLSETITGYIYEIVNFIQYIKITKYQRETFLMPTQIQKDTWRNR